MGIDKQERHRSGAFKQSNKLHKTGRHRSKGTIENEVKGKVAVKALSKRVRRELRKEERKNQSQQIRQKKRDETLAKKRSLGGPLAAPLLVVIIPLNQDIDTWLALNSITKADADAIITRSSSGATHIGVPRFKQRFSFVIPPVGNTFANLDAVKVADTILFLASAESDSNESTSKSIDDWGEEILLASIAQGLPSSIVAIVNLESLHPKKRQDGKQRVQKLISKWLPEEKVVPLDKATDALNILRRVGSQKQRNVSYRDKRPHLLAEHVAFKASEEKASEGTYGTLEVSGYLRGMPLSVNGLVYIAGFGEFQMSQIDAPEDPYLLEKSRSKGSSTAEDVAMEGVSVRRVLEVADPNVQESLKSENIPDPMDAEQTWPTKEELADAEAERKRKIIKRVPKGTSVYQAAWIPDVDGEEFDGVSESESEEEDEMELDADEAESMSEHSGDEGEENEDYETITVSEAAPDEHRYDEQMDLQEENLAIAKIKDAKLDARFPDEKDTPQDIPAKDRFQKYRGLESFRTSLWDPKENLPADYARIFQFENFDRMRKRMLKESSDRPGAMPGWYITIHVPGVHEDLYKAYVAVEERPLVIFGLLPHEQKMSVLNVVLKRTSTNTEAIKSKERLIFQCGFRRFTACPIFSQHTNGNKHKYERYFQPDSTVAASMYAPVTYSPCPVLCYLEKRDGSMELIATGNVLSANPNRIVVKRVILSGYPFKVHKRSAVVRFMFFNRDDIEWFKPIQLHTKHGRRGHIKEPLGTHGHMKCVFDGQLKSQDTILMNLYKRVFPKWTYDSCLLTGTSNLVEDVEME